jgi:hypothetical protein
MLRSSYWDIVLWQYSRMSGMLHWIKLDQVYVSEARLIGYQQAGTHLHSTVE